MNYFEANLSDSEINSMSSIALAHLGDSVFELLTRLYLCRHRYLTGASLHKKAAFMVNAEAQAASVDILLSRLDEEELAVFKRGKNTKVNSVPKNASLPDYHKATGLEALFGYLYLKRRYKRLSELFGLIVGETNGP